MGEHDETKPVKPFPMNDPMLRNDHMADLADTATRGVGESLFGPRPYIDPLVDMEIWALIESERESHGSFALCELEWAWGLVTAEDVRERIKARQEWRESGANPFEGLRKLAHVEHRKIKTRGATHPPYRRLDF